MDANALSVAVKRLRDKLTDAPIKTVRPGLHLGGKTVTPAVCGALALAALGGASGWPVALHPAAAGPLDRMLADAVDGSFRESRFD